MNFQSATFLTIGFLSFLGVINAKPLFAQESRSAQVSQLEELERKIETQAQSVAKAQERVVKEQDTLITLEQRILTTNAEVQRLDQDLFDASLSPSSFPEVLALLQTMRVQLKVDLAGMRARLNAQRELNDKENPSAAINERKLEIARAMSDLTQKRAEHTQKLVASGNAPQLEAQTAEIELNNAKLRVLEAQEVVESARSNSTQANRDIILDLAEKESRLAEVEALLNSASGARRVIREIESQQQSVERLQIERQESAKKLERFQNQLEGEKSTLQGLQAALEANRKFIKE